MNRYFRLIFAAPGADPAAAAVTRAGWTRLYMPLTSACQASVSLVPSRYAGASGVGSAPRVGLERMLNSKTSDALPAKRAGGDEALEARYSLASQAGHGTPDTEIIVCRHAFDCMSVL